MSGWSHSWVGRVSVAGTCLLAVGGFVLSFAALRDLAVRVGMPADLGWIWPLLIDGMIVEATLAVVVLAHRGSRAVWYAWFLLAAGAVTSVGSNGVHAMVTGHGLAGAAAASVPPVVLLATTHLTVLLLAAPTADAADATAVTAGTAETVGPAPEPGGAGDGGDGTEPLRAEETVAPPAPPVVVEPEPVDGKPLGGTAPAPVPEPDPGAGGTGGSFDLGQWVRDREAAGVTVTGAMVAEELGVSASTGRRRLAKIREARAPRLRLAGSE